SDADNGGLESAFADDLPQFKVGQLVRHRRYDYRGVIVDFDMRCRAPDNWYQSNKTQPDRDQPWYHVLVDGSEHTTYAAETSLMAEPEPAPIHHPLVDPFFAGYENGQYQRNDRPWPSQ
ncbi:MAG: heat shock protein HspQ, partial [Phycisphaeraceae bacterium]|nr:heat shock protein HspQ [Phycisphaeraceae bacterium]